MLGLGALSSPAEVTRVATGQLTKFADPREEITAGIIPASNVDTPYLAFRPGDSITVPSASGSPAAERLIAMTVTVDDSTGRVVFTPTLRDRIIGQEERLAQATKKMINGTFGGASQVAQPVVPTAKATSYLPSPAGLCFSDNFDGGDNAFAPGKQLLWSTAGAGYDLDCGGNFHTFSGLTPGFGNLNGTAALALPDESLIGGCRYQTVIGDARDETDDLLTLDMVLTCDWGYPTDHDAYLTLMTRLPAGIGPIGGPCFATIHHNSDGTGAVNLIHFGGISASYSFGTGVLTGLDRVSFAIIGDQATLTINGNVIATFTDPAFSTSMTPGPYFGFQLQATDNARSGGGWDSATMDGAVFVDNFSACAA
jgi:hypothetical protein